MFLATRLFQAGRTWLGVWGSTRVAGVRAFGVGVWRWGFGV